MIRLVTLAVVVTVALAVVVTVLALQPPTSPPVVTGPDKLLHVAAFVVLAFPVALIRPRWVPALVVALAVHGGLIELIQPSFGRSGEWADWFADLGGVAVGAGLGIGINQLWQRSRVQTS